MSETLPIRKLSEPEKIDIGLSLLSKLVTDTEAIRRLLELQQRYPAVVFPPQSDPTLQH